MAGLTDYRMLVTAHQESFYTPLSPETDAEIAHAYKAALGAAEEEDVEVEVMMGRKIRVRGVRGKACIASFAELCDKPLGAADYLALARTFPRLFFTKVPVLYLDRREVVRRLITMLDILYEERTLVVFQMDAPPQQLFKPAQSALNAPGVKDTVETLSAEEASKASTMTKDEIMKNGTFFFCIFMRVGAFFL
jgi:cell division protein ZapE